MTSYTNPWTGKPVDKISDLLPQPNGQTCDECGSPCIDNCIMCGAPQCCPACCYVATPSARITGDKDRENPVEGAPYGEGLIGRIDALEVENAELERQLKVAREVLDWIAVNYENGHINHIDYRVEAKHRADDAIANMDAAHA